jgi:hypothetical protein
MVFVKCTEINITNMAPCCCHVLRRGQGTHGCCCGCLLHTCLLLTSSSSTPTMKKSEAYLLYTTLYSLCSKNEHCMGQQHARGHGGCATAGCACREPALLACLSVLERHFLTISPSSARFSSVLSSSLKYLARRVCPCLFTSRRNLTVIAPLCDLWPMCPWQARGRCQAERLRPRFTAIWMCTERDTRGTQTVSNMESSVCHAAYRAQAHSLRQ